MTDFEKIISLLLMSKIHRRWYIGDIDGLIIPPLILKQYRLFHQDDKLVGFVSWALLTDEVAEGFKTRTIKLQPDDWNAGKQLWMMDFIAPFGGVLGMARQLHSEMCALFPEKTEGFLYREKNKRIGRYGRR